MGEGRTAENGCFMIDPFLDPLIIQADVAVKKDSSFAEESLNLVGQKNLECAATVKRWIGGSLPGGIPDVHGVALVGPVVQPVGISD